MTTETTGNTRTLNAYAIELLRFPRYYIERQVDFTECRNDGQYDVSAAQCVDCQFGPACRWLDQHRTSLADNPPLDQLTDAIESATYYLQKSTQQLGANDAEVLSWIREARRFLRASHD